MAIPAVIEHVLEQIAAVPVTCLKRCAGSRSAGADEVGASSGMQRDGRIRYEVSCCLPWPHFAVALGILIVVHEFGHYRVARWCGVKVLRFSVGFGKPLGGQAIRRRTATEWVLAAFPLGGYVKMLDEREGEVAAARAASCLQPPIGVAAHAPSSLAGPLANFLLAIVLVLVAVHASACRDEADAGRVPSASPAAAAGVQARERS